MRCDSHVASKNMSQRTRRLSIVICWVGILVSVWALPGGTMSTAVSRQAADLPDVSDIPTVNPVAYASESIGRGKATFLRLCAECHDEDGRALAQTLAPAADLTDPGRWKYGTDDAYVFLSIRDGAGDAMPVYGNQLARVYRPRWKTRAEVA